MPTPYTKRQGVDDAAAAGADKPMVRVRFVNTPEGKDVLAVAREGDNLMKVRCGDGMQSLLRGTGVTAARSTAPNH